MSKTYGTFKTDSEMESKGIIIDYGEAGKFQIARAGGANKAFNRAIQKLSKPYRRAIQANRMDEEVAEQLLLKAFCKTCLLGWENVTGPDGEPLEYSMENAQKLLVDLPDLWDDLRTDAQNAELYRQETREADSGN